MSESLAGTYFTSWEYDIATNSYQLGPIVVVGSNNSVIVDGVTIKGATVSSTAIAWSSASGNGSSAVLAFAFSQSFDSMTFSGIYWTSGSSQPASTNIYGFITQSAFLMPLEVWNDTYYCYENSDGNEQSVGELVVASPKITFAGKSIVNRIYTGLGQANTNELAWFTSDGNENNVAISFFFSPSDAGVMLFNGNIWPAGQSRPEGAASSVNNFYGTTQSEADAEAVDALANEAQAAENLAVNLAMQEALNQAAKAANQADENEADDDNADDNDLDNDVDDAADDVDDAADDVADVADDAADDVEDAADDADVADVAEDAEVGADLAEAVMAVPATPDASAPVTTPRRRRKASGLSAKQLLGMRDRV